MNFRGKVKAIVSEAGVKKLTRQLHSRPRNIPKAVDRLNQRDYRRTSGKARSGDREAIEQLAQMHKQRTTKPVKLPVKLPVLKKVKGEFRELSPKTKAYIKKVKAELNLSHTEIPFREKVKDLLEDKKKDKQPGIPEDSVSLYHPDSVRSGTQTSRGALTVRRGSDEHAHLISKGWKIAESSDHAYYKKVKAICEVGLKKSIRRGDFKWADHQPVAPLDSFPPQQHVQQYTDKEGVVRWRPEPRRPRLHPDTTPQARYKHYSAVARSKPYMGTHSDLDDHEPQLKAQKMLRQMELQRRGKPVITRRMGSDRLRRWKKGEGEVMRALDHTEIPFREKVKDLLEADMHPFYQKVKALSRGKKSQSILEKKSKVLEGIKKKTRQLMSARRADIRAKAEAEGRALTADERLQIKQSRRPGSRDIEAEMTPQLKYMKGSESRRFKSPSRYGHTWGSKEHIQGGGIDGDTRSHF